MRKISFLRFWNIGVALFKKCAINYVENKTDMTRRSSRALYASWQTVSKRYVNKNRHSPVKWQTINCQSQQVLYTFISSTCIENTTYSIFILLIIFFFIYFLFFRFQISDWKALTKTNLKIKFCVEKRARAIKELCIVVNKIHTKRDNFCGVDQHKQVNEAEKKRNFCIDIKYNKKMADENWKKRVGLEINYSSSEDDDQWWFDFSLTKKNPYN